MRSLPDVRQGQSHQADAARFSSTSDKHSHTDNDFSCLCGTLRHRPDRSSDVPIHRGRNQDIQVRCAMPQIPRPLYPDLLIPAQSGRDLVQ